MRHTLQCVARPCTVTDCHTPPAHTTQSPRMTTISPAGELSALDLGNLELWKDGPPHEIFDLLRRDEPLHWSALADFEHEAGFWSVVRFEDIAAVGRDHETFSSERSIILVDKLSWDPEVPDPMDIAANMMITQDPPRHDRMKALVQRAFTPKRAIEHTERMREIINLVFDRALEAPSRRAGRPRRTTSASTSRRWSSATCSARRARTPSRLVDWTNRTTAFEDPRLVARPRRGLARPGGVHPLRRDDGHRPRAGSDR